MLSIKKSKMLSPFNAYVIWAVILVVILALLVRWNFRYYSILTIALLISFVVLLVIYPYRLENNKYVYQEEDRLLGYIATVTIINTVIYVLYKGFTDTNTTVSETK